jgi:hypothetical protein
MVPRDIVSLHFWERCSDSLGRIAVPGHLLEVPTQGTGIGSAFTQPPNFLSEKSTALRLLVGRAGGN